MSLLTLCTDILGLSKRLRGEDWHDLSRKLELMLNHVRDSPACHGEGCPFRDECNAVTQVEAIADDLEFAEPTDAPPKRRAG